ncbi:MAG TPA: OmpH family outer membrane protein [Geminicoccaceae bacterium]|nr:OmpH family outer membrane protein [Geminicoccaceae bacterium]
MPGLAAETRRRGGVLLRGAVLALGVAAAAPLLAAAPTPAPAEELPAPVVAVIDYQRVMRDAAAARSIREQLEARRRQFQEEISSQEQQLHQVDKDLAQQRSVLTPEIFAERRREFEAEVAEVQRLVQQRRRQLDRASGDALDRVKQALIEVVTGMAEDWGFNLVLPSSEVLFFGRRLDLTEEVLARLDQALPTIQVPDVAAEEQQ